MKASTVTFLVLLVLPIVSAGSQRDVTVKVLVTYQQTLKGVGVGGASGAPSATMPCSEPFPADATVIDTKGTSSVSQCTFTPSAAGTTTSVQSTRVKAILTMADGLSYYVYLDCQKQYGNCAPLKAKESYIAKISDDPKQFADFVNRHVAGAVKLYLRPDGKSKVSYTILFATRASPQP